MSTRFHVLVRSLALAFFAIVPLFAAAQAPAIDSDAKQKVLGRMSQLLRENAFVPGADFALFDKYIEESKKEIDDAKDESEFADVVNRSLRKLGYSHVTLVTKRMAEARRTRQGVGIGIQIQREEGGLRVMTVFADGPAHKAGMVVGDLIVKANGKKIETSSDLVGEENSEVELDLVSEDGSAKTLKLVRKKFSNVRPETISWADKDTAVLKVPTFDFGYSRERVESLVKEAQKARHVIVDLRNNPGGTVLNLVHLLGFFLPEGSEVGTFISRRTVDEFVKQTGDDPADLAKVGEWSKFKLKAGKPAVFGYRGKVAVLVNGASGSASEIAAAALNELISAPVVGSKSAGAVLVSIMSPLPEGFLLQYPITDYVTSKGVRLEGKGVVPTAEVDPMVRYGKPDPALERALALLTETN